MLSWQGRGNFPRYIEKEKLKISCPTPIINVWETISFWMGWQNFWWLTQIGIPSLSQNYMDWKIFQPSSWNPSKRWLLQRVGCLHTIGDETDDSFQSWTAQRNDPYGNLWMRFYLWSKSFPWKEKTWKRNYWHGFFPFLKSSVVGLFWKIKPLPRTAGSPGSIATSHLRKGLEYSPGG